MAVHRTIFVSVFVVVNLVILTSCTIGKDLVHDKMVNVKRIDSNNAYIKYASFKKFNKEATLICTVKLRRSGRGAVRDYFSIIKSKTQVNRQTAYILLT